MNSKTSIRVLKRDGLGTIGLSEDSTQVIRNCTTAVHGVRWLARILARRESRALTHLFPLEGIPAPLWNDGKQFSRSYITGEPMHRVTFEPQEYFRNAARLLRQIHRHGVAHNDLAKEANWLRSPTNAAGIIDFQLAMISRRRSRVFRILAREDLRHLLKHKQHYAAHLLTQRERQILSTPSWLTLAWRKIPKPIYHFVTRRALGWKDRDGPEERIW